MQQDIRPPPHERLRRQERSNDARFLTFSCHKRLPLLGNDRIRDRFVSHVAAARERHRFQLIAYVVMPEHAHLIVLPDQPVASMLQFLKRRVAMDVIARWRELDAPILHRIHAPAGKIRFWQAGGGYDRNLVDGRELRAKIRYIHENPVKRGLVERPEDWNWSSSRACAGWEDVLIGVDLKIG